MPVDASIPLGVKPPDQMQTLSSLMGVANGVQTYQANAIPLQERQAASQFLSSPSNYTDESGNIDGNKLTQGVMKVAPTTGASYVQGILTAQKMKTEATSALSKLTDADRERLANTLATIPPDAPPAVVHGTIDALDKQYDGRIRPVAMLAHTGYDHAAKLGVPAVSQFMQTMRQGVLPQETQRALNTPNVAQVDNGQQVTGVNIAPGVPGIPQGGQVYSVQKKLPPNTPVVGANNQPGYFGPQPSAPAAQPGMTGQFVGDPAAVSASIDAMNDPQERANARAAFEEQARRTPGFANGGGFVPSGPVPGANESKGGDVAVMNEHWTRLNAGAADSPTAQSLLSTIRGLAPKAIDGTEAGKRSYWNGLLNAVGLGDKKTGDMQTDTDMLNKAMAQLNLATPATTDAMRTLVEAGRPHSTMSAGAITEAANQIEGQIKANRAMRDTLQPDKQYASATGDPSHYQQKRQALEQIMDPRIFEYESLPAGERKAFMGKLNPQDRATLINKAKQLETMGIFK